MKYENTKLQAVRLSMGMSQSQLAALSGVAVRKIQSYEQGERDLNNANLSTLLAFCQALNCKLSDIISDAHCLELLRSLYGE